MPNPDQIASQIPPEVPVFLRKTYVMICCSPKDIAGWTDDGKSFVVKHPERFEREIIPQFFKHSKFTSFVRQLNFYAFRKIKYMDSIRINPKLDKETANYWRFRHDNFLEGKPQRLTQIKRTNGHKPASAAGATKTTIATATDGKVQSEVQVLKKQIEEMTKNMDALTAMVEKVSLKQDEQDVMQEELAIMPGSKRKKVDVAAELALQDLDSMTLDPSVDPVVSMPPMPLPPKDMEMASSVVDHNDFVEQLFDAFADENELHVGALADEDVDDNKPDPILMKRLSDALMLLPQEIQEMIVDKLVAAITSTDFVANVVTPLKLIPQTEDETSKEEVDAESKVPAEEPTNNDEEPMPLAAETLLALLQHYGPQLAGKKPKNTHKSIPVIPVHA